MFKLSRCIAFGVNVGDFLKFEGAFQSKREAGAPSKIEYVSTAGEIARKDLNFWLDGQRFAHQTRHFDQRAYELSFVLRGEDAAGATCRDRKTSKHRQLTGERLARCDANFRSGKR